MNKQLSGKNEHANETIIRTTETNLKKAAKEI